MTSRPPGVLVKVKRDQRRVHAVERFKDEPADGVIQGAQISLLVSGALQARPGNSSDLVVTEW